MSSAVDGPAPSVSLPHRIGAAKGPQGEYDNAYMNPPDPLLALAPPCLSLAPVRGPGPQSLTTGRVRFPNSLHDMLIIGKMGTERDRRYHAALWRKEKRPPAKAETDRVTAASRGRDPVSAKIVLRHASHFSSSRPLRLRLPPPPSASCLAEYLGLKGGSNVGIPGGGGGDGGSMLGSPYVSALRRRTTGRMSAPCGGRLSGADCLAELPVLGRPA